MIALLLTPRVVVYAAVLLVAVTFAAAALAALLSPSPRPLGCGRADCETCARVAGYLGDDNDSPVAGDVASDSDTPGAA